MKTFSEATAIKSKLLLDLYLILSDPAEIQLGNDITVSGQLQKLMPINTPISIKIIGQTEIIKFTIDGIDIPNYHWCQTQDIRTLHIPCFYPWYHDITGQGWIA